MCRLLGIYGQVDFWQEIALEFRKQADFGSIPPVGGMEAGHKDGWGMTGSNKDRTAMVPIIRRLGSASDSVRYRQAVTSIDEAPDVFLGHLRKASEDIPVTLANAHPFFHSGWAFIHNGTVYDAESLPRDASLVPISDESDTEYLFHYFLSAIMKIPANKRIGETLTQAVFSLTVDYTAVNSMLSNGEDLYVINGYKKWEDYYALHCYCLPAGIIISSQPIESSRLDPAGWKRLDNNLLLRIHGNPPRMDKIPIANNS